MCIYNCKNYCSLFKFTLNLRRMQKQKYVCPCGFDVYLFEKCFTFYSWYICQLWDTFGSIYWGLSLAWTSTSSSLLQYMQIRLRIQLCFKHSMKRTKRANDHWNFIHWVNSGEYIPCFWSIQLQLFLNSDAVGSHYLSQYNFDSSSVFFFLFGGSNLSSDCNKASLDLSQQGHKIGILISV